MAENDERVSYSCVIFYSFSVAFFALSILNGFCEISNFKMTVLAVVSVLLSVQQLLEAREELANKITVISERVDNQHELISKIDHAPKLERLRRGNDTGGLEKSRVVFAIAIIVLVVGLAVDFDFENSSISSTLTIMSFAVIFSTMGVKEMFSARVDALNEETYKIDQRIIAYLNREINSLKK